VTTTVRKLTVCVTVLFRSFAEENINPVERDRAAADDCASGYRAPEDIRSGEVPNCEQRSKHRHQNAGARNPERDTSDQAWIEKAAPWLTLFRVGQIFFSVFGLSNGQGTSISGGVLNSISLCDLCALCVSVVSGCRAFIHH
jgi:hypothetical protein